MSDRADTEGTKINYYALILAVLHPKWISPTGALQLMGYFDSHRKKAECEKSHK